MSSSITTKNILITGGCGYIGSYLIRDLINSEYLAGKTIRILDNFQNGQYQSLMKLPNQGRYQFIEGDILDPSVMEIATQGIDTVIHLAAIVRTPMSFDHPAWVDQVNHWGTSRLIEDCLKSEVRRIIFTSTTAVYGPGGKFTEADICRPIGPYAQSKLRAERSVSAAVERGLQTTVIRLGTVFGLAPFTRFDAFVNRFAYLAGIGRALTVYGTGDQRRPVINIADVSSVIQFCIDHPDKTAGLTLNAVVENPSVNELAEVVQSIKPDTTIHYTEQDVLTHLSFEVSSAKMHSLGWQPAHSLQDGVSEIIAQFKNFHTTTDIRNLNDLL